MPPGPAMRLSSARLADPVLASSRATWMVDRARGQEQPAGHPRVGQALCDEVQHLGFA